MWHTHNPFILPLLLNHYGLIKHIQERLGDKFFKYWQDIER